MSIPKVAITGGPAAGKTTILGMIPKKYGDQALTMPEVASILLDGGFPKPGKDIDYNDLWADNFQESVIAVQKNMENQYIEMSKNGPFRLVIFDRGLLDGSAYLGKGLDFFLNRFNLDEQELYDRYDMVIHLESVAVSDPDLYERLKSTNPARYENASEAVERDLTIKEAWENHPNRIIISSAGGIELVKDKVINLLDTFMNVEIERKFLLSKMPSIPLPAGVPIKQGYLPLSNEVRVRNMGDQYYLTIKTGSGLSRQECEPPINKFAFQTLFKETGDARISKTRFFIPYGDYTLELDEYHGDLKGLVTMECEFKTVEEANAFVLPTWAKDAQDITHMPELKNRSLASKKIGNLSDLLCKC